MNTILRYETAAADIYAKLKTIPRTGWMMHGVANPETVYDHTVSLVQLANSLAADLQLSATELDDLTHILEIHDWAEAVVGDEFIPNDDALDYAARKKVKAKQEHLGLQTLLQDKSYKDIVIKLFDRYEASSDRVAKLAKELDKYQALELALTYEQSQGIPLFSEFYEYYLRDWPFSNRVLLEKIKQLVAAHTSLTDSK